MVDHVKSMMRNKSDHIILYVGSNDILSDKDAGDIAKLIGDLVESVKPPICDLTISNIITRKDKHYYKAQKVHKHLKEMCTN